MFVEWIAAASIAGGQASEGVWRSRGYGYVVAAEVGQVRIYDVTASSCALTGEAEALGDLGEIQADGDGGFVLAGDTSRIAFEPIAGLPERCATPAPPTADPLRNFDVLWETFAENYPYFELRGVDWTAVRDEYRPRIAALPADADPWPIFTDILGRFQDAHVRLTEGERRFQVRRTSAGPATMEMQRGLLDRLRSADGPLAGRIDFTPHERLAYGVGPDGLGYLAVLTMGGFSNGPAGWPANTTGEADLAAAREALETALAGLRGTRGLVLDLRYNPGGSESISALIASCFADQRRLAYTRSARDGAGRSPGFETHVEPGDCPRYVGPVVVLVGERTTSAAEALVMRLRVLPEVTVVGQPTQGAHSDVLARTLPNGWRLGLSNEIYTLADGGVYEGVGIPPDIATPAPTGGEPEALYDADIRRGFEILAGAGKP
jgi:carboxyl-terminal processing protease